MNNPFSSNSGAPSRSSFLPEDYLARKHERRMTTISVTLFVIVTFGVVGAFFVTNRERNDVRRYQKALNVRYTQAAKDIEQLKVLEEQKTELIAKANVTTALIERVPKSIFLAELINRMPDQMTLLELNIKSTRTDVKRRRGKKSKDKSAGKSLSKSKKSSTSKNAAPPKPQAVAPKYATHIVLDGVAPSHQDVAYYVKRLQSCDLLAFAELRFSEKTIIENREMNKFRIEMDLRTDADARTIEPDHAPTLKRVVSAEIAPDLNEFISPEPGSTPRRQPQGGRITCASDGVKSHFYSYSSRCPSRRIGLSSNPKTPKSRKPARKSSTRK